MYTGSDANIAGYLSPSSLTDQPTIEPSAISGVTVFNNNSSHGTLFYGLTSIVGNLFPYDMGQIISHLVEPCHYSRGKEMHSKLLPVVHEILTGCSVPVGLKYAMKYNQGKANNEILAPVGGFPRLPLGSLSTDKQRSIRDAVDTYYEHRFV